MQTPLNLNLLPSFPVSSGSRLGDPLLDSSFGQLVRQYDEQLRLKQQDIIGGNHLLKMRQNGSQPKQWELKAAVSRPESFQYEPVNIYAILQESATKVSPKSGRQNKSQTKVEGLKSLDQAQGNEVKAKTGAQQTDYLLHHLQAPKANSLAFQKVTSGAAAYRFKMTNSKTLVQQQERSEENGPIDQSKILSKESKESKSSHFVPAKGDDSRNSEIKIIVTITHAKQQKGEREVDSHIKQCSLQQLQLENQQAQMGQTLLQEIQQAIAALIEKEGYEVNNKETVCQSTKGKHFFEEEKGSQQTTPSIQLPKIESSATEKAKLSPHQSCQKTERQLVNIHDKRTNRSEKGLNDIGGSQQVMNKMQFELLQIQRLKLRLKMIEKYTSINRDQEQENHKQLLSKTKSHEKQSKKPIISKKILLQRTPSKRNSTKQKQTFDETQSHKQFESLQALISQFSRHPKPHHSPQKLTKLAMYVFSVFDVDLDSSTYMDLTRSDQVVQFQLGKTTVLIWFYTGCFYLLEATEKEYDAKGIMEIAGEGYQIHPNTSCYKGSFKKNKKHGQGIYVTTLSEKYQGSWKNGVFHGKGKLITSLSQFTGEFVKGYKHGDGIEHFANGDTYQGQYSQDRFHGSGEYTWKNRDTYVGQFRLGQMQGKGVWKSSRDSYYGQYHKNMKHGFGIYRWGNGKEYEGYFERGHCVSKSKTLSAHHLDMVENENETFHGKIRSETGSGLQKRYTVEFCSLPTLYRKRYSYDIVKM